jgi:membrane protein implicated in regulation of membrane protease activity
MFLSYNIFYYARNHQDRISAVNNTATLSKANTFNTSQRSSTMIELQFWHWIIFAFALLALELFAPSFIALCLGLSALLVSMLLFFAASLSFATQLFAWVCCSVIFVILFFKFFKPRMKNKTLAGTAREAVIGEKGRVVRLPTETQPGTVRFTIPLLGSDEWQFLSEETLALGDSIKIHEVSGNTLIVKKVTN